MIWNTGPGRAKPEIYGLLNIGPRLSIYWPRRRVWQREEEQIPYIRTDISQTQISKYCTTLYVCKRCRIRRKKPTCTKSDQKRIHTQPNRLISKIENYWSFIFAGNQVPGTFLRRRKLKLRPLNVEMFNFSSSFPSPKSIPMPLPAAVYFQTHADSIFPDRNLLAQSSAHTQLFPSIEHRKSKY